MRLLCGDRSLAPEGWEAGVRVGPFTGRLNPFLRSWAREVAVWAACLDYHLWG